LHGPLGLITEGSPAFLDFFAVSGIPPTAKVLERRESPAWPISVLSLPWQLSTGRPGWLVLRNKGKNEIEECENRY